MRLSLPNYLAFARAPLMLLAASCAHVRPATDAPSSHQPGLLIMAHGGSAEWNASVLEAVTPLERTMPVAVAFGMADPNSLQHAVDTLEHRGVNRIAVVRLFVSVESFRHDIEYFFGLRQDPPKRFAAMNARKGPTPPPLRRTAAVVLNRSGLSDASLMGEVLAERALAQSTSPESEAVLIIGHGMGNDSINDELITRLDTLANHVRASAPFQKVVIETLREDWTGKRAKAEYRIREIARGADEHGLRLIVIPFRLSGFGPYREVLEGLPYVADGLGLLPHENVTRWIEQQAAEALGNTGRPTVSQRSGAAF